MTAARIKLHVQKNDDGGVVYSNNCFRFTKNPPGLVKLREEAKVRNGRTRDKGHERGLIRFVLSL